YELVREGVTLVREAFPDFQLSIDEQVAEGDRIGAHWTMTGTHEGEFYGIPPTGKQVKHSGATFYRLANGRIAEVWFLADMMGLMQQLGVIPTPETA
ncbi:MAG: ester cyclase, partial [Chloroflexota bacterium]